MIWFAVWGERNRALPFGGVVTNHLRNWLSSAKSIVCQSIRMLEQYDKNSATRPA
jgi:hypothetical protein